MATLKPTPCTQCTPTAYLPGLHHTEKGDGHAPAPGILHEDGLCHTHDADPAAYDGVPLSNMICLRCGSSADHAPDGTRSWDHHDAYYGRGEDIEAHHPDPEGLGNGMSDEEAAQMHEDDRQRALTAQAEFLGQTAITGLT